MCVCVCVCVCEVVWCKTECIAYRFNCFQHWSSRHFGNTSIFCGTTLIAVFTAETWAIIIALKEIKNASSSKCIVITDSLSCIQALQYMKLEHPLIGMVIRKCLLKDFANKDIIFVRYPAILALKVTKRMTLLPSLLCSCLVPTLVKPIMISAYKQCSKDVLCRARVGQTHLTHSGNVKKDPPPQSEHCRCFLTVRHILVECNHFVEEMWWNHLDSTSHTFCCFRQISVL